MSSTQGVARSLNQAEKRISEERSMWAARQRQFESELLDLRSQLAIQAKAVRLPPHLPYLFPSSLWLCSALFHSAPFSG